MEDVTWQAYGGEKPDLSEKSVTTMEEAQLNVGRFHKKQKSALTPKKVLQKSALTPNFKKVL